MNLPMTPLDPRRAPPSARGFTLVELLFIVSLLVIIMTLAAPNLRIFLVRNKVSGLSNEFSAALLHARGLAVSRNTCVTLCAAQASNGTVCAGNTAVANYNVNGWLMFENPVCNAAETAATAASGVVLSQRTGTADGYSLKGTAAELNSVMFDPRGYASLAVAGTFEITPAAAVDVAYKRRVCLDAAGRPTVRSASSTC
jgi:type IV fimbrial biogenesis protein FimT